MLLKSKKIDSTEIIEDIVNFRELKFIEEISLNSSILILALSLREEYNLTYFDSLHCASALKIDGIIISSDSSFNLVHNLKAINPSDVLEKYKSKI